MLENTVIVQVYVRAQGPPDPRFGDEIDDRSEYAYDGWLPLTLSAPDEDGRRHATVVGDPWLSTPPGAKSAPDPGPAPVRITAADCSAELRQRARLGLRYFIEETPEERDEPYERKRIAENVAEQVVKRLERAKEYDAARDTLTGVTDPVEHVEITIAKLTRIRGASPRRDNGATSDACHKMISDFIAAHHRELVAYVEKRASENSAQLRTLMQAALRLDAFNE